MKNTFNSLKEIKALLLIVIATGIWVIVWQNHQEREVYVNGGKINASIYGTVDVGNTVDINIHAINGHRNVFFNNPRIGDKDQYYLIPVATY